MDKEYTKKQIEFYRQLDPSFELSKKEALTYAAKMGATDSLRGLKQIGAKFFNAEDTLEELKKQDKKLQSILENKEYGTAATGTFLSSAVIADPIGWVPILGTAKKAKNIIDFAKYGAMAGGFHSGIGYVSEEAPGLLGEKQTRLENTLIGVGAGGALGVVAPSVVNAVQKVRGKEPIYGLTKDIEVPEANTNTTMPRMKTDEEISEFERKAHLEIQEQTLKNKMIFIKVDLVII